MYLSTVENLMSGMRKVRNERKKVLQVGLSGKRQIAIKMPLNVRNGQLLKKSRESPKNTV